MKMNTLATLLIGASCIVARGQGTVFFSNGAPGAGIDAPVYHSDAITPLSGAQFMAELLAGVSSDNLVPVATTGFLTGTAAGYFNGGIQQVPGIAFGAFASVQVDVWNTASGASLPLAQASGLPDSWWQSSVFSVRLGGGSINPYPPGNLDGLGTSPVYLNAAPEPSMIALLGIGSAMVFVRFVRRQSPYGGRDFQNQVRRDYPAFCMTNVSVVLAVAALSLTAYGQGTVQFSNLSPFGTVNAPVYQSDGVTPLSGSQFMAELLAGSAVNNLALTATTGFHTGTAAGYFNGGGQAINGVSPGDIAWVQVDVWNTASGATFDQAKASGLANSWWASSVFSVTTGGGFQGPPPVPLIGLGTSPVYLNGVPEPCTLVLTGLAAILLLFRFVRLRR